MWFWIALMAFFLIVYLVTKAVVRSQGGIHHVGLQQGYDVSLSGGWSGTGDGLGDAGAGWIDGGAGGDGGFSAGEVGAGDSDHSRCQGSLTRRGPSAANGRPHHRGTCPAEVPPACPGREARRIRSRVGSTALIAVMATSGVAACTSSEVPASRPSTAVTSTASATALGASEWPPVPAQALPTKAASRMEAEVRGWVDKELLPGVTVAVVSPEGVWTVAAGVDGDGTPLQGGFGDGTGQHQQDLHGGRGDAAGPTRTTRPGRPGLDLRRPTRTGQRHHRPAAPRAPLLDRRGQRLRVRHDDERPRHTLDDEAGARAGPHTHSSTRTQVQLRQRQLHPSRPGDQEGHRPGPGRSVQPRPVEALGTDPGGLPGPADLGAPSGPPRRRRGAPARDPCTSPSSPPARSPASSAPPVASPATQKPPHGGDTTCTARRFSSPTPWHR